MTVWLTPDGVAERLGISRRTALVIMHEMPHSVLSGKTKQRLRVSEDALDAWMMKRTVGNYSGLAVVSKGTGSNKRFQRR